MCSSCPNTRKLVPTLRYLELPEFSPHSKKLVLPLTDPVTRPLCF